MAFSISSRIGFAMVVVLAILGCSKSNVDREGENLPGLPVDCSPGEIQDVRSGIINGKTVAYGSWIEKSTVLLLAENPRGEKSACTATIISPTVLLTAAHCVPSVNRFLPKKDINLAVFSANPFCQKDILESRIIAMKKIIVHPHYDFNVIAENDLALVLLAEEVPQGFQPVKVIAEEQSSTIGDSTTTLISAGFGKTAGYETEETHAPRLRATQMRLIDIVNENYRFDQKEAGLCAGDSGGPLYAQIDGSVVLAGVSSAVAASGGGDSCRGRGYASSISYHRDFLKRAFTSLSGQEKNPF